MLPFIPSETIQNISGLNYGRVVQVSAGYKKWSGARLDAFGGLVPAVEKRDILGILFPSSIFEGRAPEGGALLSVFLGGVKNPEAIEKNDKEIASIVLKEISATLFNSTDPDLLRINRYMHAIPQYEKSSGLRFETIKNIQEKHPGLILAGNIRDGIGMADRVKQAKTISDILSAGN
jgi:oxygen-dependent protoporphyrinogen oxidase